jgi:DNA mismatch repair protein MutL
VQGELEACGFELMRLSGRTVAIKAAPADLPATEARALLAEILDTIERERRGSARQDWRDHIAAKLACRAAVKAHTKLAPEKLRWLIDNLLATDAPATGPHGRPGIMRLSTKDIEKGLQRG